MVTFFHIVTAFVIFSCSRSCLLFAQTLSDRTNVSLSTELLNTINAIHTLGQTSSSNFDTLKAHILYKFAVIDSLSYVEKCAEPQQRAQAVCEIARLIFPGRIISSNSSCYTSEQHQNWFKTCWLPAACFILTNDTFDVAAALKVISHVGSKFAVRSGGHNPNAGFGSINETGVLLDLQLLKSKDLQPNTILRVGTGNTWGQIYDFLEPYNLSVQGGLTFFPNLLGLGADSLENIEIVLANSSVINANASINSNLFQALKGGGPNFGIVTRFDILTHSLHRVWYKAILNATIQVQIAMEHDAKLGFFVNFNPSIVVVGMFYAQWTLRPIGFASFDKLTPVGFLVKETNGTISTLAASINIGNLPAKREPYAVSHGVDLDLYLDIHEKYLAILNTTDMRSANLTYTIQPLAASGVTVGLQRGGNSLGLILKSQTWHASLVEWFDDTDDYAARRSVNMFGSSVEAFSRDRNEFLSLQFMNDASSTQQPLKSYGKDSLCNLKATSLLYDPDKVFQVLQNSGFLMM